MARYPKRIPFQGQERTVSEVASILGRKVSTIYGRLERGQSLTEPPRYGPVPKKKKRAPAREQGPVVPIEKVRSDYVASVVAEFGKPGNPTTLELAILAAWDSGFSFAKYGARGGASEQEAG